MKFLDRLALSITIIAGLNWLLIAVFNFNLVTAIFGEGSLATNVVYIFIGLSSLWSIKYFSYTPNLSYRRRK